jgi:hypothetical protein
MERQWAVRVMGVGLLALVAAGCQTGRGGAPSAPGTAEGAPREGYAHLAELITLHPLYPELARLDTAITALRTPGGPGLGPPAPSPDWARPEISWSSPFVAWPADLWETRRSGEEQALTGPPAPESDEGLPQDLQVSLDARTRAAQRAMREDLAQARSAKSRELSDKATQWTRGNQDLAPAAAGGEAADVAARTRADLDARVEALRREQEDYLTRLGEQRRQVMAEQIAAAREAALRAARQRRRTLAGPEVGELAQTVAQSLQPLDLSQWPARLDAELPAVRLPRGGPDDESGTAAEEAAWDARRAAAAQALVERRAALQDRILAATRLAAERVARQRGWRVRLDPAAETGQDLTREVGNALRGLWSKET